MDVLSNYVDTTRIYYTDEKAYIDDCKVLRNFQGFKKGDIVDVYIDILNWNVYINNRRIYMRIYENEYSNLFAYDYQENGVYKGITLISNVCEKFPIGSRFSSATVTNNSVEFFNHNNQSVFSISIV